MEPARPKLCAALALSLVLGAGGCGQPFRDQSGGVAGSGGSAGGAAGLGGSAGVAGASGGRGGASGQGGVSGQGGASGSASGSAGAGTSGGGGGSPCSVTELLVDGGFDGVLRPWTESTDKRTRLLYRDDDSTLVALGVQPVSPHYLAWLGVLDGEEDVLSQVVSVPPGSVALTLSGQLLIQTNEDNGQKYDTVAVEVQPGQGSTYVGMTWSNLDETSDWARFEVPLLASAYAGRTITLRLHSIMDDGVETDFLFDSLSLSAQVCPAL